MPSGARYNWRKVRRRPQDILPIAFLNIRPLDTEQPTGNAFETVDHARHRVLRWVVDEQVYVFGLTVHLDELRLEVRANFLEHDLSRWIASPSNTFLLYLVTNTKWTCNAKTQCLP